MPADPSGLAALVSPFEVLATQPLTEGRPIVARLVGRKFDQLVEAQFEKPFDARFGKMMLKTLSHLCAALGASYGYCERTEMSLFAVSNGGEARRLLSRISGEASAKMALLLGEVATFEARLYEFTCADETWDYFRWRREEAQAQALDVYCVHVLITSGSDPQHVPMILQGLDHDEKVELLRQNGLDYAKVPAWQRLGAGVYVSHDSGAPGQLVVDLDLPDGEAYPDYLKRYVA
jgi:tRNA(His) guanylyltransferase